MAELIKSFLLAILILVIYANILFLESTFLNARAKLTVRYAKGMFGIIIPAVFLSLPISTASLVMSMSLQIIYVMRIADKVSKTFPDAVAIKHTTDPYYYLLLYWRHFLKPALTLFILLIPALVLIFLSTWV